MKQKAQTSVKKAQKTGTVLIVEDDFPQRLLLENKLTNAGFRAEGPDNVQDTLQRAQELGDNLAVVILDMRLDDMDPSYPDPARLGLTGTQLGKIIRQQRGGGAPQPQFIVLSAWAKTEFYEAALELGVAAYLKKEEFVGEGGITKLTEHVRALYLRWKVESECLVNSKKIKALSSRNSNAFSAIAGFCQEILVPSLSECFGSRFIILLQSHKGENRSFCNLPNIQNETSFTTIQSMTFAEASGEPLVLESNCSPWDKILSNQAQKVLDGAAFISLPIKEIRLTIGILKDPSWDAKKQLMLIGQYFSPALIEQTLKLLTEFTENEAQRTSFASLSKYISTEQLRVLNSISPDGLDDNTRNAIEKLRALSEDLSLTGYMLQTVSEGESCREALKTPEIIWDVVENLNLQNVEVNSSVQVWMERIDLYTIISRLLQWFGRRGVETPGGAALITIQCEESNDFTKLTFIDKSRRLPNSIRDVLFEPFAQGGIFPSVQIPSVQIVQIEGEDIPIPGRILPLYLVKKLVESRYLGSLTDESDQIKSDLEEEPYGHRFVLSFPLQPPKH